MKAGAVRKLSGAELRAMRDQRAAADPKAEAWAHESSFLRSLATAQEDFDWIVANEAWTHLGHDTFSAWWEARAPRMSALGFQPTRQIALAVLAQLRADDEKMPKAQRRTNRQLAASVGLPESTMRRVAPRSLPAPNGAAADLGRSSDVEASGEPETLPAEAYRCEKCRNFLAEPFVQRGERRCINCDADRTHVAAAPGDSCLLCSDSTSPESEAAGAVTPVEPAGAADVVAGTSSAAEVDASTEGYPADGAADLPEGSVSDAVPAGHEPARIGLVAGNPHTAAGPEVEVTPSLADGDEGPVGGKATGPGSAPAPTGDDAELLGEVRAASSPVGVIPQDSPAAVLDPSPAVL